MKFISRTDPGIQPVYDIGVYQNHNFLLGNGLIAHNCFNKSHGVSYSLISYICAYLKAHHATEFFCALMTVRSQVMAPKDWAIKAPQYVQEAKILGVGICQPDINRSEIGFTTTGEEIFFGLNAIRNVGITAARSVIKARGDTPFASVGNFLHRVDKRKVTTKVFTALAYSGAFDRLGYDRNELVERTGEIYDYLKDQLLHAEREREILIRTAERAELEPILLRRNELRKIKKSKRQRDLTQEEEDFIVEHKTLRQKVVLKPKKEAVKPEIKRSSNIYLSPEDLISQKEFIGCYLSQHPAPLLFPGCEQIRRIIRGTNVHICGEVINIKKIIDKNGNRMCFLTISDGTASGEAVVFSRTYSKLEKQNLIPKPGDLIKMGAKCEAETPNVKLIANYMDIYRSKNEL